MTLEALYVSVADRLPGGDGNGDGDGDDSAQDPVAAACASMWDIETALRHRKRVPGTGLNRIQFLILN